MRQKIYASYALLAVLLLIGLSILVQGNEADEDDGAVLDYWQLPASVRTWYLLQAADLSTNTPAHEQIPKYNATLGIIQWMPDVENPGSAPTNEIPATPTPGGVTQSLQVAAGTIAWGDLISGLAAHNNDYHTTPFADDDHAHTNTYAPVGSTPVNHGNTVHTTPFAPTVHTHNYAPIGSTPVDHGNEAHTTPFAPTNLIPTYGAALPTVIELGNERNVNLTGISTGDVLYFNGSIFLPTPQADGSGGGGGGSGYDYFRDLLDTSFNASIANGAHAVYSTGDNLWHDYTPLPTQTNLPVVIFTPDSFAAVTPVATNRFKFSITGLAPIGSTPVAHTHNYIPLTSTPYLHNNSSHTTPYAAEGSTPVSHLHTGTYAPATHTHIPPTARLFSVEGDEAAGDINFTESGPGSISWSAGNLNIAFPTYFPTPPGGATPLVMWMNVSGYPRWTPFPTSQMVSHGNEYHDVKFLAAQYTPAQEGMVLQSNADYTPVWNTPVPTPAFSGLSNPHQGTMRILPSGPDDRGETSFLTNGLEIGGSPSDTDEYIVYIMDHVQFGRGSGGAGTAEYTLFDANGPGSYVEFQGVDLIIPTDEYGTRASKAYLTWDSAAEKLKVWVNSTPFVIGP